MVTIENASSIPDDARHPATPMQMELLPFKLHDFTRFSWVSDRARETWEPRIAAIVKAWTELEWLSTHAGLRECCYVFASPEEFMAHGPRWAELGLNSMPIEMQGMPSDMYTSTGVPLAEGQPFRFRFVLGGPEKVLRFREAWQSGNDDVMGEMLGYPPCCRRFFKTTWVAQGLVDTTWPMAANSGGAY